MRVRTTTVLIVILLAVAFLMIRRSVTNLAQLQPSTSTQSQTQSVLPSDRAEAVDEKSRVAEEEFEIAEPRTPPLPEALEGYPLPPSFSISDLPDDYVPVVKVVMQYPPEAVAQELSGYVLLQYTVGASGRAEDLQVMDASSPIFEIGVANAVGAYRYKPRFVDGEYVSVHGIRTLVVFGEVGMDDLPEISENTDVVRITAF